MISSRIPGHLAGFLGYTHKTPLLAKGCASLKPSFFALIIRVLSLRTRHKTSRGTIYRAPLAFSNHLILLNYRAAGLAVSLVAFTGSSARRDHDRGRPSHADRASGARVHSTTGVGVPSTTLLLRGAHVSSGLLACCCNRAFQSHGPARDPHEPVFFGNRRLLLPAALPQETLLLRASLLRKRIVPVRFSIDW